MYQAKQTKDVPLRKDVRKYLASRERMDIISEPSYNLENIKNKLPAAELQFLSVFDLHLSKNFIFESRDVTLQNVVAVERPGVSHTGRHSSSERPRSSRVVAVKQATDSYNYDQLDSYRKTLFGKLNDSVGGIIDGLGAFADKYRWLTLERSIASCEQSSHPLSPFLDSRWSLSHD